ncbi:VOC family protein [Streptomyces sp. NPDC005921]
MRGRSEGQPGVPRISRHDWWGVVLEAPDPQALARFYAELLGWEIVKEEPDGAAVAPPEGVAYLAFQLSEGYVPPVWPARAGAQRMPMLTGSAPEVLAQRNPHGQPQVKDQTCPTHPEDVTSSSTPEPPAPPRPA